MCLIPVSYESMSGRFVGHEQELLTVNGQFPGPLLEANWGDIVEVTIHNNITHPEEGTAMHWHGSKGILAEFLFAPRLTYVLISIHQEGTNYMDGVSGITQCPIVPGGSFTYRWKAIRRRALGPMVIYGPSHVDYDYDLGPVTLSDYYHYPYETIALKAVAPTEDISVYIPRSNNHLINGRNNFNCSLSTVNNTCNSNAPLSQFNFKSGKVHKLRLINTSVEAMHIFSIDGHNLTVTTMDFVPVEPYEVEYIILGVGMRADVLVKGIGNPKEAYYARTRIQCAATNATQALAIVHYEESPTTAVPPTKTVSALPNFSSFCGDPDLPKKKPIYKKPLVEPDLVLKYNVCFGKNSTGNHMWLMNGDTFLADWGRPLYLEAAENNTEYLSKPQHILATIPDDVRHVRVIINNHFSIHPMHIHGGDFQILSEGNDTWDGSISYSENPARADTELLRRDGHLVIQFEAKNPGVWSFHCHTAWHASIGLIINFLVKPNEVQKQKIPKEVGQVCSDWHDYIRLGGANAAPFDSGLRL
ncbi:oxydoreductase ptaK [Colletotrichum liriopes]|uniref:Oxydoreductase ptaK n=1 Tax=Colletotrichum liriopes TaxID=708192 RepID=A0AA37GZA2_9PEZI|nr:oxydoreductase ptaK [Colletotrichum liriopes]